MEQDTTKNSCGDSLPNGSACGKTESLPNGEVVDLEAQEPSNDTGRAAVKYGIEDNPPIYLGLLLGLQVILTYYLRINLIHYFRECIKLPPKI